MYSQYQIVQSKSAVELLPGTTSAEGAAVFINPLTVLSQIGQAKLEGFNGIVHTAAASQLGQMLVKACQQEHFPLINIVRKQDQVDILKSIGAKYVLNSSSSSFLSDLENAIAETGIYLAFDATGGGTLIDNILTAMEKASSRGQPFRPYGSPILKKVYIYGGLDPNPTILSRGFGIRYSVNGWLVWDYLTKFPEKIPEFEKRIVQNLKTTFKTTYDKEISLSDALDSQTLKNIARMATGEKYLVNPNKAGQSKL